MALFSREYTAPATNSLIAWASNLLNGAVVIGLAVFVLCMHFKVF